MKSLLPTLLILLSITFLSHIDYKTDLESNFSIMSMVNDGPELPDFPFEYKTALPEHLLDPPPDIGYEGFAPDTTLLNNVENHGATLGRVLFYDEKLSALEDLSCASCHLQSNSFADNKDFSQGVSTLTSRNSMGLNDIAWTANNGFFWDMRSHELHEAIKLPLRDDNEIGAEADDIAWKLEQTTYYPQLFENAYGDATITEDRIVDALVQFVCSINSFNSKFDEGIKSDFSNFNDAELRGKELFSAQCSFCHSEGPMLGSVLGTNMSLEFMLDFFPDFFSNNLESEPEDPGVGVWREGLDGLYKIPTLRNIELTGPYMHNGSLETLDDVINFYSEDVKTDTEWSMISPLHLTNQEKSDLKAFLLTLTDHSMKDEEKWSNPFKVGSHTEETLNIDVKIFPNPFNDFSIVEILNEYSERVDVTIVNMEGRIVKSDYFTSAQYRIDKDELTSGAYYLYLTKKKRMGVYKFIVK